MTHFTDRAQAAAIREATARERVHIAVQHIGLACNGEDLVSNIVCALDHLCHAASLFPALAGFSSELTPAATKLLAMAGPLKATAGTRIPPEVIMLGLQGANAILTLPEDDRREIHYSRMAILTARLVIDHHEARLRELGDGFRVSIGTTQANSSAQLH